MNWGVKIFILYTGFVVLTLSMVFFAMNQEISLVEEDYYKQEIAYQDQIDKITNARRLKMPLRMEYDSLKRQFVVTFPREQMQAGVQGEVVFFRPSDAQLDRTFTILPDATGAQLFVLEDFKRGRWRVKVRWESNGVDYFEEELIDIF